MAVGDLVIANSPQPVTKWAIDTFGTADKLVLIGGTLVLLARVRRAGSACSSNAAPGARCSASPLIGLVAGYAVLAGRRIGPGVAAVVAVVVDRRRRPARAGSGLANRPVARGTGSWRTSARAAEPAALPHDGRHRGGGGRRDARGRPPARRQLRRRGGPRGPCACPAPPRSVDLPIPSDAQADGAASFVTSNEDFYRIDINLDVPQIDPETHVIRITGMVDQPFEISYRDLLARDLVDIPITMTCVSFLLGGRPGRQRRVARGPAA